MSPRSAARLALASLVALALFLRAWPIGHGLPRNYVPDTHVVRNALGMAKDRDLVPPVGRYSSYPYLMPYLLLPVYAAEYLAGRELGAWRGSDEFGARAMEEPAVVQLPARALAALFGAATAWVVFRAARAAGLQRGAWVAAALAATSLLSVQLSTHERPWVLVVFFGALALWGSIVHASSGSARSLLGAAAAAGLAFASHQAGLAMLGLPALAWLVAPRPWRGGALGRRVALGAASVLVFAAVALVLGHAYYLKYGRVPTEAVIGGELAEEHPSIGGQAVRIDLSLARVGPLAWKYFGYEPALVVLGLGGLWLAFRRRTLAFAMTFLVFYAAFFLANPSDHVRYLLPLSALLALPAGLLAERLLASRAGTALVALALGLALVQALRFDCVLRREDTRAEAERALAALPAGSLVAIDHYGPAVDLSQRALERLAELRGELRTRESHRLEQLRAGVLAEQDRGVDAIAVEELFEVDPASLAYVVRPSLRERGSTPAALLSSLGVTHFLEVERRPRERAARPLASLASDGSGGRVLATIDPARPERDASPPREAFLPTEMDFPLCALWEVERPGPWMRLVELAP